MKTCERWANISSRAGRNDLPALALEAIFTESLHRDDWGAAIADAWTMAEWPSRVVEGNLDMWEYAFDMATDEGCFLTDEGHQTPRTELGEGLTLWRGCYPEFSRGMSWTMDREVATWFAKRMNHHEFVGHLYTITIPRDLILGRFDVRKESEFVVAVSDLMDDDVQEVTL